MATDRIRQSLSPTQELNVTCVEENITELRETLGAKVTAIQLRFSDGKITAHGDVYFVKGFLKLEPFCFNWNADDKQWERNEIQGEERATFLRDMRELCDEWGLDLAVDFD